MTKFIISLISIITFTSILAQDFTSHQDSFDENSGKWDLVDYPNKKSKIKEGKYILESLQSKRVQVFLKDLIINPEDDYFIQAKITRMAGREKGVRKQQVSQIGFGETKPVSTNETPGGRQLNRRVEFSIL
jgi:hypothetical protein